ADLVAPLAERSADRRDPLGRTEAVPEVGVPSGRPKRLGRPRATDEDRHPRLDGEGSDERVIHAVEAAVVGEALAIEEPPDETDRFVEPVQAVPEARSE